MVQWLGLGSFTFRAELDPAVWCHQKENETKQKHTEKWSPVSEFKHPSKSLCMQMFESHYRTQLLYLEGHFAFSLHYIGEGWRLREVM